MDLFLLVRKLGVYVSSNISCVLMLMCFPLIVALAVCQFTEWAHSKPSELHHPWNLIYEKKLIHWFSESYFQVNPVTSNAFLPTSHLDSISSHVCYWFQSVNSVSSRTLRAVRGCRNRSSGKEMTDGRTREEDAIMLRYYSLVFGVFKSLQDRKEKQTNKKRQLVPSVWQQHLGTSLFTCLEPDWANFLFLPHQQKV